ncbi:hypothetical protein LV716_18090 [Flagellimonas sp. HMM57]|uniref:hypothetical protein n=1 Tax=unclassified Flagellimonas TaxID=2644544 RepID=UPI0013D3565F|nr:MULTISPECIES: hypothetical protein [unclassified Flagellimonas]UII76153.1 hypothetical protein LV716_18090 [Flagellimonas sp. HMM57]
MKRFLLLFILVSLFSCKAQNTVTAESSEQDADIVLIDQDNYSGILEYDAMVIKDAKSLNKFYSKINKTRKPGLPVPTIDFTQYMVVIICMGEQKGNAIPVLSKTETLGNEMIITVKMPDYHKDKSSSEIITYPFYLYRTPTVIKPVSFEKVGF